MSSHGPLLRALEITPPVEPRANVLLRRARALDPQIDSVNVIDRAGRTGSLQAAEILADSGVAATWNLTTRGRSASDIDRDLGYAADRALTRLVCVRGERGVPDLPDTPPLHEAARRARSFMPEGEIGATLNPYAPGDRVLKNLFGKLEAGASFVQTNLIFRLADLDPMAEEIRASFPNVRILLMVRTFSDSAEIGRVATRVGAADTLAGELGKIPTGIDAFAELLEQIESSPLYAGITVMTPRMDVDEEQGTALRNVLGRLSRRARRARRA